ncbi:MAG: InlB B-repeat-containing protein, partial [Lachnospiraceae bacterium]|nr:InlB B-repeat-containing protein [Lachnospiraceae bacterium]
MKKAEAAITITAASQEWTYDGAAHQNTTVKVTEGDLFEGDELSATATGNVTNVEDTADGNNPIAAGYKIMHGTEDVTANYAITTEAGTLTIAQRQITVKAKDGSKVYDSTPLKAEDTGYEITGGSLVDGDTEEVTLSGEQTLVGSSPATVVSVIIKKGDNDVTKNYKIETADGTLTVTDGTDDQPVDDNLVVKKTVDNKKYKLGETVTFTVSATNIYAEARDIKLIEIDGVTLETSEFKGVKPGETVNTTASYVIKEADILKGSFKNTVTAKIGKLTKHASATAKTEDKKGHLTVEKVTTSETPEKGYPLGATIEYKITVKNDGNLTITDITVTDELTGDEWKLDSLAPGKSKDYTAKYTVTEADVMAGQVVNVATAKGKSPDPDEPDVPVTPGKDPEPTEDKKGHLTVEKITTSETPEKGYPLGATIEYKITVKNDGNLTITDITVTDELTGDEWTLDSLKPGESKDYTASYTVTEADVLAGEVLNVATAKGTSPDPDEPDVPVDPGKDPEPTEEKKGHLTVEKVTTSETPEKGYALGETIEYKITVKNDGNLTITDITVTDELTGDEWKLASLEPGESKDYVARHTVTEADVKAGQVVNVATAKGKSPDPEDPKVPVDPGKDPEPTTGKKSHMTVTKVTTSETPKGGYPAGSTIEYKITVTNDGDFTINDITVTDDLTGDKWTVDSLEPGESKGFNADYTVTEADVAAGEVVNVATASGTSTDPDSPDVPVEPGIDPEPTAEGKGHLTVNKITTSKAPEGGYPVGATIEYKITVMNDGNYTITDITVTDELTGDEWAVASLAPGESKDFTAYYTVTEADAMAGEVVNVATAKGTSPDPDEPEVPVDPGTDPEPIAKPKGHLTVNKVTTSETPKGGYSAGDTIEYKITAINDGDLTIKDITVTDELTGDEWTVKSLAPGKSKDFTAKYTVTEADVAAGEVVNVATAKGTSPDPDQPDVPVEDGIDPEPTAEGKGHLTVKKAATSKAPEGGYPVGAEIEYKITVINDGDYTITDITVTDKLTGDEWTLKSLAPGESKDFTAEYTVTEADAEAGEVVNVATARGTSPDPENPDVPAEDGTDTEPVAPVKPEPATYEIRYKLNGGTYEGSEADIVERYPAGTVISIHEAPEREGYTFDYWKGSAYQPGDQYTVTGDHVFTAQWKKVEAEDDDDDDDGSHKTTKKHSSGSSPRTGDDSNTALWLVILLLAAAGATGTVIYRKKNHK